MQPTATPVGGSTPRREILHKKRFWKPWRSDAPYSNHLEVGKETVMSLGTQESTNQSYINGGVTASFSGYPSEDFDQSGYFLDGKRDDYLSPTYQQARLRHTEQSLLDRIQRESGQYGSIDEVPLKLPEAQQEYGNANHAKETQQTDSYATSGQQLAGGRAQHDYGDVAGSNLTHAQETGQYPSISESDFRLGHDRREYGNASVKPEEKTASSCQGGLARPLVYDRNPYSIASQVLTQPAPTFQHTQSHYPLQSNISTDTSRIAQHIPPSLQPRLQQQLALSQHQALYGDRAGFAHFQALQNQHAAAITSPNRYNVAGGNSASHGQKEVNSRIVQALGTTDRYNTPSGTPTSSTLPPHSNESALISPVRYSAQASTSANDTQTDGSQTQRLCSPERYNRKPEHCPVPATVPPVEHSHPEAKTDSPQKPVSNPPAQSSALSPPPESSALKSPPSAHIASPDKYITHCLTDTEGATTPTDKSPMLKEHGRDEENPVRTMEPASHSIPEASSDVRPSSYEYESVTPTFDDLKKELDQDVSNLTSSMASLANDVNDQQRQSVTTPPPPVTNPPPDSPVDTKPPLSSSRSENCNEPEKEAFEPVHIKTEIDTFNQDQGVSCEESRNTEKQRTEDFEDVSPAYNYDRNDCDSKSPSSVPTASNEAGNSSDYESSFPDYRHKLKLATQGQSNSQGDDPLPPTTPTSHSLSSENPASNDPEVATARQRSPSGESYERYEVGSNMSRSESLEDVSAMMGPNSRELFYCHLCSYVGNSKFQFNVHMSSHFEHACPHCDYTSRTEGRLKRHIKDFHGNNPPNNFSGTQVLRREPARPKMFRCRQCDFISQTKVEFWEHARSHIKDDKILQCPKCPFVTEYKHHLEYHLRNHFGSKPFKCNKCNYACVNKSMLNSHMKSHTNVYQYRCADCTYATKYCHSLKLHLSKYNHMPATVLNADGSLPVDGTGDFEMVSKRGPPRGPRGPRKDHSPPQGMASTPVLLPQSPHNGSLFAAGLWPMMGSPQNGLHPPPPLIPVSGIAGFEPHLPQEKISGHLSHQALSQQQHPSKLKCNFCEFVSESYPSVMQHMWKIHASEHQDLFRMFDLPPELLVADKTVDGFSQHEHLDLKHAEGRDGLATTPETSQPTFPNHLRRSPSLSEPRLSTYGSVPDEESSLSKTAPRRKRLHGDRPLDLTKPKSDDDLSYQPSPYLPMAAEMSHYQSPKRKLAMKYGKEASGTVSPTPRKRPRKGKAYKLDTIAMKLQEKYSDTPTQDYDSNDDDTGDYDGGRLGSEEASSPANRTRTENMQEQAEIENAQVIESRFQALNPEYIECRGDSSSIGSGCSAEANDVNRSAHSEQSGGSSRRKLFVARRTEFQSTQSGLDDGRGEQNGSSEEQLADGSAQNSRRTDDNIPDASPMSVRRDSVEQAKNKNNQGFECHHCDILFRDCIMYTMHMGYHGYRDAFTCNMCGHQANDKVEFFLHIARAAHE